MNASIHPFHALALGALLCLAPARLTAADSPPPTPPASTPKPTTTTSEWKDLFDGVSLDGWKIARFGGAGEVEVQDGHITLAMGAMLTGVTFTNPIPRINYEISLEAKRTLGSDFFCALTAPFNNTNFTLIVGGWGGGVVGISSLDGYDASENDTTKFTSFEKDRWYTIRLRVTTAKIEAWIDGDKLINATVAERRVGMRFGEIELSAPLGVATYQTGAALRNIRLRSAPTPDTRAR